jgi:hypothetical protein
MEKLLSLIDAVFPVPGQFRGRLNRDVAELSRLLTSARGERGASYLSKPAMLSAYLRCFLPWNVYRLVRLLAALPLTLADGDTVTDLGSGPLTLPIALWIARPELRQVKLFFRCVDKTQAVLEAGQKLFAALTGVRNDVHEGAHSGAAGAKNGAVPETAWTIKTMRHSIPLSDRKKFMGSAAPGVMRGDILQKRPRNETAPEDARPGLVCAVNVYNEIFWDIPHSDSRSLVRFAEQEARRLTELAAGGASILVVEPGVPRSGEFIAALRAAFAALGRPVLSPCTHGEPCPFPGGKGARGHEKQKWCHFAFDTAAAPKKLKDLSAAAGIPKERATLSFLLTGGAASGAAVPAETAPPASDTQTAARVLSSDSLGIRVLSDQFPVTGLAAAKGRADPVFGRYGCCKLGAVLITGTESEMAAAPAGTLLRHKPPNGKQRDPTTGALIVRLSN